MNKPFILSAAVVFAAGSIFFARLTSRLAEVRSTGQGQLPAVKAAAVPARSWAPPPAKRPEPEGRLLDRLGERLIASLDLSQVTVFLEATDITELGRLVITAGLTPEERSMFEAKFADFRREQAALLKRKDLSRAQEDTAWKDLAARKSRWIADQLGEERTAKVGEARKVAARAGAERDATRLVSRISDAADLTTAQKDRLYATFLDRAQSSPGSRESGGEPLQFRVSGTMKEEPPVPDILEEARGILTPEQWALREQTTTLTARQQETMMSAIKSMAPTAILTLQEFLDEKPAAPGPPPTR